MARKNTNRYHVATAQSLAASFSSTPTIIKNLDNCSYQIDITTTNSIGTFSVQGSNDYDRDEVSNVVSNTGHWITLTLGGTTATPVANAANDDIIINLNQLPFNAIRIIYTAGTAGTGHCDIWLMTKQIGG